MNNKIGDMSPKEVNNMKLEVSNKILFKLY